MKINFKYNILIIKYDDRINITYLLNILHIIINFLIVKLMIFYYIINLNNLLIHWQIWYVLIYI